jgi:DNA-directed RNA polymerase subunit RPC12/RpoP
MLSSGSGNAKAGLGLMVIGGLLLAFSCAHVWRTFKNRPSDVVLSDRGLTIQGGPHSGTTLAWGEIDRYACILLDVTESRLTLLGILRSALTRDGEMGFSDVDVLKLQVGLTSGNELVIAEAERPIEMDSLRALHESIRSANWGEKPAGTPPAARKAPPVSALLCTGCGATVPPDEKPIVACRYCNTQIAVPPDVQERVRAARQVSAGRAVSEKLVIGLLQQPGASRTNSMLVLLGIPMMLSWPLAAAIGAARGLFDTIEAIDFLWLCLFPLATILALFLVLRAQLTDRQALRLLTLDFGAKHPARPGDPFTCRSCEAPLPDANDKVVVRCAYCSADNVLGLDMRREARPATEQAKGLEEALAQRKSERTRWTALTVLAGFLLLIGVGSLAMGLGAAALAEEDHPTKPKPAAAPPPAAKPAPPPPKKK